MDLTEQAVIIFSYWLIAKKKKKKQIKTKKWYWGRRQNKKLKTWYSYDVISRALVDSEDFLVQSGPAKSGENEREEDS